MHRIDTLVEGTDPTAGREPPRPRRRGRRERRFVVLGVGAVAAIAVLVATRRDPLLSPDSITYLSAAEHLRSWDGYVDFTGEPLAHFPPVFPLLLMPGGRSVWWAAVVGAVAAAVAAALFTVLLTVRVRWVVAIGGGVAFALSQALVRLESTVWSEAPYLALALATMTVLRHEGVTGRRAVVGGVLGGLGFMTRYAGAGLVVTGLAMVVAAAMPRGRRAVARHAAAYSVPVVLLGAAWMIRNLLATGRPLGPHFEGGAGESPASLIRQTGAAVGRLVTDLDASAVLARPVGYVVLLALVGVSVAALVRRPAAVTDVGMAVFALSSIIVPVASRAVAGTHIEPRIMTPALVPALYFAAITVDRLARRPAPSAAAIGLVAIWVWVGATAALSFPDRLGRSAADPAQFSPRLYELVAELPADAHVLTNNPQRVWWHSGRVPISFAFTQPTPGNSHFPLSRSDTVQVVCDGDAYLAWFPGLDNAGGRGPDELRPDLADLVELEPLDEVPGGTLFGLTAVSC